MLGKRMMILWLCQYVNVLGVGPQTGWERPGAPLDRLYDEFFTDLQSGTNICVGMNTQNGPAQCYSDYNTANLYPIDSRGAWEEFKTQGGAWTVVYSANWDDLLEFLKASENWETTVAGVLVQLPDIMPTAFSPNEKRPNNALDIYNGTGPVWNPGGAELWNVSLPVIVILSESDMQIAVADAAKNRGKGFKPPLRAAQFNYAMRSKGMTSIECLQEGVCDLLGRQSIWATTDLPVHLDGSNADLIALALPISATSLFTDVLVPGQGAVVGSLVAALAVVDAIADVRSHMQEKNTQLLVMMTDADNYGLAGSLRLIHDFHDFQCRHFPDPDKERDSRYYCLNPPVYAQGKNFTEIRTNRVRHLVAFDQLGLVEDQSQDPNLFIHWDGPLYANSPDRTEQLINSFIENGVNRGGEFLPPSATHAWFHNIATARTGEDDIGVAVFAGYNRSYENKYYGSMFDLSSTLSNNSRLSADLILKAAEAATNAIWKLAGLESETVKPVVDPTLVRDLLHCLSTNITCDLVQQYACNPQSLKKQFSSGRVSYYNSVAGSYSPVNDFIYSFLAEALAVEDGSTNATCSIDSNCNSKAENKCQLPTEFCVPLLDGTRNGRCLLSPVFFHTPMTPALAQYNDGAWVLNETYKSWPAWTESRWNSKQGIRLFTSDSKAHEVVILVIGIVISLLSGISVFLFRQQVLPKMKDD